MHNVMKYLDEMDHPYRSLAVQAREIIIQANDKLTEQIKWNAPSFSYAGEDRITFNFQGKKGLRIIFHTGAQKKGKALYGKTMKEQLAEEHPLLKWLAEDRAMAEIARSDQLDSIKAELQQVVNAWLLAASASASADE